MPLSLFDHKSFSHFRSINTKSRDYNHTFGGQFESFGLRFASAEDPSFHLIYRLDLRDPALPIRLEGIKYLPLVYGFRYAAHEATFVYRVLNDGEIELLAPEGAMYDPDHPYSGHPEAFPVTPVSFERVPFDPTVAEDALSLQGVFGLDQLSQAELKRAIPIALADHSYVCYSLENTTDPNWTDEQIVRFHGRSPFMQSPPIKSCTNPKCTAEIAYRVDEREIEFSDPRMIELLGTNKMKTDAYDVRVDTMRVFALHQPEPNDSLMWGDPYVQMTFEFCDVCHCIRVSNQCT